MRVIHLGLVLTLVAAPALADTPSVRSLYSTIKKSLSADKSIPAIEAIGQLGELNTADAAKTLLKLPLLDFDNQDVFKAWGDALRSLTDGKAQQEMVRTYESAKRSRSGWKMQVLLIDALAPHATQATAHVLKLAVVDKKTPVRLVAVRAMERCGLRPIERIEMLIASLEATEKARDWGTPHHDTRMQLKKLTGFDHGNHKLWAAFWEENKADYTGPPKKDDGKDVKVDGDATFYGQYVTSRRLLFVIDVSGSMQVMDLPSTGNGVPSTPPNAQNRRVGVTEVTDPQWNKWVQKHPEVKRIVRAREELKRLIYELSDDAYFNIITFSSGANPWQRKLMPAKRGAQMAARKYCDGMSANGGTDAHAALKLAFEKGGPADTIYFLSDGHPSDATPMKILSDLRLWNRYRRVRIHTVGIGGGASALLKPIAKEHGGEFYDIKP